MGGPEGADPVRGDRPFRVGLRPGSATRHGSGPGGQSSRPDPYGVPGDGLAREAPKSSRACLNDRITMMPQGTIKDYDEQAREGSLLQDDRTEIFIDRTSTEGSNVRTLRIGQRVSFDVADEGGRPMARGLRLVTFS